VLSCFGVTSVEVLAASVLLVAGVREGATELLYDMFGVLSVLEEVDGTDSARVAAEGKAEERLVSQFCRKEGIMVGAQEVAWPSVLQTNRGRRQRHRTNAELWSQHER